jgi:hypothetical protein
VVLTATVTVAVAVPLAPVALRVYVVVWDGVRSRLPVAGRGLWSVGVRRTVSALVVCQVRVVASPWTRVLGVAVKLEMVGMVGDAAVTATVTVAVVVPPEPVALRMYVVVCVGVTSRLPDTGRILSAVGVRETVWALVVLQFRVVLSPATMVVGTAMKLVMVGEERELVTVTVTVALAIAISSVMVYKNVSVPTNPAAGV